MRRLLSAGAYLPWVQGMLAPAQYWHDPFNPASYVSKGGLIKRETRKKHFKLFSALSPTHQQCQTSKICIGEGRGGKTEALCDDYVEK